MEPLIVDRDDIIIDEELDIFLDHIVDEMELNKMQEIPIVFDDKCTIINYDELKDVYTFRSMSSIAYYMRHGDHTLMITFEIEMGAGGGWHLLCIRDCGILDEHVCNPHDNEQIDKARIAIKKAYDYHCNLLSQSLVKSAKN